MKFVAISDTHGHHRGLTLPPGDVLLHTGDVSDYGEEEEIIDFLEWLGTLDYEHKVFIGGNHDNFLELYPEAVEEMLPDGVTYLNNDGVEINNVNIWGSPVVPGLYGWTFGRHRGHLMEQHWQYMPFDTQILMTHVPPYGILDKSRSWRSKGCTELLHKVYEVAPVFHIFGHVHASYGQIEIDGTTFINAAISNSHGDLDNEPVVFEF